MVWNSEQQKKAASMGGKKISSDRAHMSRISKIGAEKRKKAKLEALAKQAAAPVSDTGVL